MKRLLDLSNERLQAIAVLELSQLAARGQGPFHCPRRAWHGGGDRLHRGTGA